MRGGGDQAVVQGQVGPAGVAVSARGCGAVDLLGVVRDVQDPARRTETAPSDDHGVTPAGDRRPHGTSGGVVAAKRPDIAQDVTAGRPAPRPRSESASRPCTVLPVVSVVPGQWWTGAWEGAEPTVWFPPPRDAAGYRSESPTPRAPSTPSVSMTSLRTVSSTHSGPVTVSVPNLMR